MKKSFTIGIGIIFTICLYSQTNTFESKPKGMEFVPQGSFQMKITRNSETKLTNVSIDAFWMSNEITNAEYREFVLWAQKNPDKKLNQIKYSLEVVTNPGTGSTKDTVTAKIIPIVVSSFNSDMIDRLCLERANKDYKDYFTNKKYNDYPVVGVSYTMAGYYCIWKTMLENEQMKEKGLPNVHAYRIPIETEWEYVAQQPISKGNKNGQDQKIQKVNEGNSNDWGLFHLDNNVSEWVTPWRGEPGLIRGGSWNSGNSISERKQISTDLKEPYIGFRIVQSFIASNK